MVEAATMTQRILYADPLVAGESVTLSADQSHHLARVLRAKIGERIELVGGGGTLAQATLVEVSPRRCLARVESVQVHEPQSKICLAFGIPKSGALDFILHKVTELGVAGFQPLITRHSLAGSHWNLSRWERVIAEVAKQCQLVHFPFLSNPLSLENWVKSRATKRWLILCDENQREAPLSKQPESISAVDLVLGPEGGWAEEETLALQRQGASLLGLGQQRLRCDTAALVAMALVKSRLGEI